jgi:iron complex outermembrane receptor protein
VLAGDWRLDGFGLHANLTRYGSVTRTGDAPDASQDQTFAARWILDLSASYHWQSWTFTVGADNLTNQYPTKAAAYNPYEDPAHGLQYSYLSPFGFNGRYWYGKVNYRF